VGIISLQVSRFKHEAFAHLTKLLDRDEASCIKTTEAIMVLSLANYEWDVRVQYNGINLYITMESNALQI
jgi:hypothetical protein